MLNWFSAVPAWIKFCFAVAGFLMTAFSGRLAEGLQDVGLYAGFAIGFLAILGLILHIIKNQRGGAAVTPQDMIILGLIGLLGSSGMMLAGYMWQRFSPPADGEPKKVTILQDSEFAAPPILYSKADRERILEALYSLMRDSPTPAMGRTSVAFGGRSVLACRGWGGRSAGAQRSPRRNRRSSRALRIAGPKPAADPTGPQCGRLAMAQRSGSGRR